MDKHRDSGFTLLEMMVAVALIGVFAGLISFRMDIFGRERSREIRRFKGFLRVQHARVLASGRTEWMSFRPSDDRVQLSRSSEKFQFQHWSIQGDEPLRFRLAPVGMFGDGPVALTHDDIDRRFTVDRLEGFLEEDSDR